MFFYFSFLLSSVVSWLCSCSSATTTAYGAATTLELSHTQIHTQIQIFLKNVQEMRRIHYSMR